MIQIEQERSLYRQCLYITAEDDSRCRDFREQMLLHNKINGILPFNLLRQDNKIIYEYSIAGLSRLSDKCEISKMNYESLSKLFLGIINSIYKSKEYMLAEDDFVILPETVFLNMSGETRLTYFSGYAHKLREQLCSLAEYCLDKIEYSDEASVMLAYAFYMKTKNDNCRIDELRELLESRDNNAKSITREITEERNVIEDEVKTEVKREVKKDSIEPIECAFSPYDEFSKAKENKRIVQIISAVLILMVIAGEVALFAVGIISFSKGLIKAFLAIALGLFAVVEICKLSRWLKNRYEDCTPEDTEMFEEEGTILMPQIVQQAGMKLISADQPMITITEFPFVIGRDKDMADYVIDKAEVSRSHVQIAKKETTVYVTDLNSTNGTYLNGVRLKGGEPRCFSEGDELRIASCVYYYN